MGAGCAKRDTPRAMSAPAAPLVNLMRASADKDASGTINRQEFEKFVTPMGNWSADAEGQVFDKADEDKNGELSAAEIEKSFKINMQCWPGLADAQWSQEDLQKFMSCGDSDGDGVLSSSELAKWHKLLDKNGDGAISSEELSQATELAQQRLVDGLFQSGDENGDSVLDKTEFGKVMGNFVNDLGLSDMQLSQLFKRGDADGNGTLSEEEVRGLVAQLDSNGDGKLSAEELAQLDKDGSGMLTTTAASGALEVLKVAAELAPNEKVKCMSRLLVTGVTAYLNGASAASAATGVATDMMRKVLLRKALQYGRQRLQQQPPHQGGAGAAGATAMTALPHPEPVPRPAEPEPPRPGCLICTRKAGGMRPLRCCGVMMCGQCIWRMITIDIKTCPGCKKPPAF